MAAEPVVIIEESSPHIVEVVDNAVQVLHIVERGPQGPQGPVADLNAILAFVDDAVNDYYVLHPQSFQYDQLTPVFHAEIVHPLDHRPDVVITDSAGTEYEGVVSYPADNIVAIDFNQPFAFHATLT